MRIRVPTIAFACATVAALGGCGDQGFSGRIEHGDEARGFPLRGSLAGDDGALHSAAQAWLDRKGSGADGKDDRLDGDADLTALWAGHVPDRDVVVLRDETGRLATMLHQKNGDWYVEDVDQDDTGGTRDVPIGAGGVVILPSGSGWRYWSSDPNYFGGGTTTVAGLLVRRGTYAADLEPGIVAPEQPARTADTTTLYVPGIGAREVDARTLDRVTSYLDAGGAGALWQALTAAAGTPRRSSSFSVRLRLLWTGKVPGVGTAVITSTTEATGPALVYASADLVDQNPSGPTDARHADSRVLGANRAPTDAETGSSGPAVGGTYIDTTAGPRLILAGTGVQTLHALVGHRELTRPGPVAVIPAPWAADRETAPDTVLFGRTAGGDLVSPLLPRSP